MGTRDGYRELRVERWARQIVARDLGLPVDRYEDGTRNGMVDAVIRSPFGLVPLEVVQDVNVAEQQQSAALERYGRELFVPELDVGWYVTLDSRAKVRDVRRDLPALLRRIDELRAGRRSCAAPGWEMWGPDVPVPLQRIGVQFMAPLCEHPGHIVLNGAGWGGLEEHDRLNGWVLEVLEREHDVPAKLRAFSGGRGDVFIWATAAIDIGVTGLLTDPDVSVVPRSLPDRVPGLPTGVDRVWVASTLTRRRAIVSDGGRWRWLNWVTSVELEAEDGP